MQVIIQELLTIDLEDLIGSKIKISEINGLITSMIILSSMLYKTLCIALQRISNNLKNRGVV